MKILTRDFDEIEIEDSEILTFVSPIYGFEELTQFVMLSDNSIKQFVWLQSVQNRDICFILTDPACVDNTYAPKLPKDIEAQLGDGEKILWSIVVIPQDFKSSTVNLKSPLVINPITKQALQYIAEEDYPIRAPLISEKAEKGECK